MTDRRTLIEIKELENKGLTLKTKGPNISRNKWAQQEVHKLGPATKIQEMNIKTCTYIIHRLIVLEC